MLQGASGSLADNASQFFFEDTLLLQKGHAAQVWTTCEGRWASNGWLVTASPFLAGDVILTVYAMLQIASGAFAEDTSNVCFATSPPSAASTWDRQRSAAGPVGRNQLPATGCLASLDVCLGAENAPGDTTSLHFDSGGELLLAGMSCGLLSVHRWEQLQAWAAAGRCTR